ncbi:MAG TPA: PspC domain-containing protein [Bryobacteraceae bacterium]|nr:PspC domain-containing protein [Bryobacteraceae bacterium]
MYCTRCGIEIDDKARFCSDCGAATQNAAPRGSTAGSEHRLYRSREDVKIAGVCAGLARYLSVDVTLVRILWLVLTFCPPGAGIIAYIICWIVMPKEPLLLPAATRLDTASST